MWHESPGGRCTATAHCALRRATTVLVLLASTPRATLALWRVCYPPTAVCHPPTAVCHPPTSVTLQPPSVFPQPPSVTLQSLSVTLQRRLPSNRRRFSPNRRRLPSNRRRLPSNRRRLPSNRRRLPSNRRRSPPIAVGYPPTALDLPPTTALPVAVQLLSNCVPKYIEPATGRPEKFFSTKKRPDWGPAQHRNPPPPSMSSRVWVQSRRRILPAILPAISTLRPHGVSAGVVLGSAEGPCREGLAVAPRTPPSASGVCPSPWLREDGGANCFVVLGRSGFQIWGGGQ